MNRELQINRTIAQMTAVYSRFGENVTQPEAMIPVLDVRERLDLSLDGLRIASAFAGRQVEQEEARQADISKAISHRDLVKKREVELRAILARASRDPLAETFAQRMRDQIDQLQTLQQTDPGLQRGFLLLTAAEAPLVEEVTEPEVTEGGSAEPVSRDSSASKFKYGNHREVSLIHSEGVVLREFDSVGQVYIYFLDNNAAVNPLDVNQISDDLQKSKKNIYNIIGRLNKIIAPANQRIVNREKDGKKGYYLEFIEKPKDPQEPDRLEELEPSEDKPKPSVTGSLPRLTLDEALNFFGLDLGLISALNDIEINEIVTEFDRQLEEERVIRDAQEAKISRLDLNSEEQRKILRGILRMGHRIQIPPEKEEEYLATTSPINGEAEKKAGVVTPPQLKPILIPTPETIWLSQLLKPEAQEIVMQAFHTEGARRLRANIRDYLVNPDYVESQGLRGVLAGAMFEELAYVFLRGLLDPNQVLLDPGETFRVTAKRSQATVETNAKVPFIKFIPGITVPDGLLLTDFGDYQRMDVVEYKAKSITDLRRQVGIYKWEDRLRSNLKLDTDEIRSSGLAACLGETRPELANKPIMVPASPDVIFVTSERKDEATTQRYKEELIRLIPGIDRVEAVPITGNEFRSLLGAFIRDSFSERLELAAV